MTLIVDMIDEVISEIENPDVIVRIRKKVNEMMAEYPLFAY